MGCGVIVNVCVGGGACVCLSVCPGVDTTMEMFGCSWMFLVDVTFVMLMELWVVWWFDGEISCG